MSEQVGVPPRNTILQLSSFNPTPTLSPQTPRLLNHRPWCHLANKLKPCILCTSESPKFSRLQTSNRGQHGCPSRLILGVFFKKKKEDWSRALNETPFHRYGVLLSVWDHTVLPASRHKRTHPALTPARGRYSIYLPRRDRRLS